MMRTTMMAASLIMMLGTSPAIAAACRDAKGKFIKCPPAAAAAAPTRCKDTKGKFAKCGTPGAKPA